MSQDRWNYRAKEEISSRAFRKAQALGHSWCGIEHVLLALLDPPRATDAAGLLAGLGLTQEAVQERLEALPSASSPGRGVVSNPALHSLLGTATGLALAFGAPQVTDEHVLLALVYGQYSQVPPLIVSLGIDPDVLVRNLAERGNPVPPWLPPESPPSPGPMGPRIYYPASDHAAVVQAMIERFPPGTAHWGFNVSRWKPGFHWIDAEESCNTLEVIRPALSDASAVEVRPIEEAASREAASRGQGRS
ncbi:MAG TPA: Clp protease N-terminal domain-containing protein [Actinomycetota bacterium]|nr:Clp protease N-terminal domain-containing protein [Actinomycetota bacterium]